MARAERLAIKTATRGNGEVDYLLVDTVTGEELLRGEWKLVREMKDELDKEVAA
jgi:hypothetical protein